MVRLICKEGQDGGPLVGGPNRVKFGQTNNPVQTGGEQTSTAATGSQTKILRSGSVGFFLAPAMAEKNFSFVNVTSGE